MPEAEETTEKDAETIAQGVAEQQAPPPPAGIPVTIDGKLVYADKGELLIAAAQRHGTHIPRFCYHERLRPVGMCRMCLVDVDTGRGPMLSPACLVECTPDMPTAGPAEAPPYDDWVANQLSGAVAFVAIDDDRVVGYATLQPLPATPYRLEHGLTAVLRSHRGRGLAQKLKRAQIAWAARHGYRELVTYTSELNAPMRAVNVKLGYEERPVAVVVSGAVG